MKDWTKHSEKISFEEGREYVFARKIKNIVVQKGHVTLHNDGGLFGIREQKAFGSRFLRFEYRKSAHEMNIRIDAVGDFGFRIRYSIDGALDNETLMAPDVPAGEFTSVTEEDGIMNICLKNAVLTIKKDPIRITMKTADGATLLEVPGIDACQPNESGAGGFASLCDYFPFGVSQGLCTFTTKLSLNEKIFGLGEKFVGMDRRGQDIDFFNTDCAGNEGARNYKNIPFYMSTCGYGVYVNSASLMDFDIGARNFDAANVFLEDRLMDVFLIAGPSPRDILYRYGMITGFAPKLPRWSYGLWMSRNSYENSTIVMEVAKKLRSEDIPADLVHLDTYWFEEDWVCDMKFSKTRFPEPRKMMKELREMGFHVCIWQLPFVHDSLENYKTGVEKDYFIKDKDGQVMHFEWFSSKYAYIDFSNKEAVKWYTDQIKEVLEMGVEAVKTDIAEGAPPDGVYKNAQGRQMHSLFPLLYNKVIFEAVKEVCGTGLVWARSTYAGGQRYPLIWSGDSRSTYENMAGALRSGLSAGLSGQPFWSHDIGGFIGRPDKELYIRWAQFGLFSSHARCHGGGNNNSREPWAFGEQALEIFRKFTKLRYRLLPYIFSTEAQCCKTGMPFIRHMALHHMEDPTTHGIYDQYYFGESMMIAPLLNSGGKRKAYLPEGTWYDFWTGEKIQKTGWIDIDCPLDSMPVYVPAGGVITLGPEQDHVDQKPLEELEIRIYEGARNTFEYENGGEKAKFTVECDKGETRFKDGGYKGGYKLIKVAGND